MLNCGPLFLSFRNVIYSDRKFDIVIFHVAGFFWLPHDGCATLIQDDVRTTSDPCGISSLRSWLLSQRGFLTEISRLLKHLETLIVIIWPSVLSIHDSADKYMRMAWKMKGQKE